MGRLNHFLAVGALVLFIAASTNSTVVLKENGYSNILVSISKDIAQPNDGGLAILTDLKVYFNIIKQH